MDIQSVINEIKHSIKLFNDNMKFYKDKNIIDYENSLSNREHMKILLCKIFNTEYQYSREIE